MKSLVKEPKPPLSLFTQRDNGEIREEKASACGECGQVYQSKDSAQVCCKAAFCEKCGNETNQYQSFCSSCSDLRRWERATEVLEHNGPVYDHDSEKYFEDYDSAIEYFMDEKDSDEDFVPPEWLSPCDIKPLGGLDLDSALESMTEEIEDGYDHLVGLKELENAVDEFNEKQTLKVWNIDYKLKIKVNVPEEVLTT
jgi:hypothetical protein